MKIRLLAFGIAKDILNARSMSFELKQGNTIAALKTALMLQYPAFEKLISLTFAVNESYVPDDHLLHEDDEIVLIPPVSGG